MLGTFLPKKLGGRFESNICLVIDRLDSSSFSEDLFMKYFKYNVTKECLTKSHWELWCSSFYPLFVNNYHTLATQEKKMNFCLFRNLAKKKISEETC